MELLQNIKEQLHGMLQNIKEQLHGIATEHKGTVAWNYYRT